MSPWRRGGRERSRGQDVTIRTDRVDGDLTINVGQHEGGEDLNFALGARSGPAELGPGSGPSAYLVARYAVVGFIGREAERREAADWLGEVVPRAARLVTGPGGQGKTRWAGQVALEAESAGWRVLIARHRLDGGIAPSGVVDVREGPAPVGVLVVVDYADRWPSEDLKALFEHPELSMSRGQRLRVLLLGRSSQFWISTARGLDKAGISTSAVLLAPLAEDTADQGDDRAQVFRAAQWAFADRLGVDAARLPQPPPLVGEGFALMLAVQMAALISVLAVRDGLPDAMRDEILADPAAASRHLIGREVEHWELMMLRRPNPVRVSTDVMGRAVFVATLTRGLSDEEAIVLLASLDLGEAPRVILDDHRRCYPPTNAERVLEPLFPDRLGEDFIAALLPGAPTDTPDVASLIGGDPATPTLLRQLLGLPESAQHADGQPEQTTRALPRWIRPVMTTLVEVARRWPHVATGHVLPLIAQEPGLIVAAGGTAVARLCDVPGVEAVLPGVGAALDTLIGGGVHLEYDAGAVLVADRLAAVARSRGDLAEVADALTTLGVRRRAVGRRQDALAAAQEAVDIRRVLADPVTGIPAVYLPALAMSLNNLGTCLSELGRRQDAPAPAQEAVDIYRVLADPDTGNPAIYLRALAMSLSNLGACLSELGRRRDGLAAAQEAVGIYRVLADPVTGIPAVYLPDLATSLSNLGAFLSELGRRQDAPAPAQEAVDIYRRLADPDTGNPAVYLPDLAMSLINLGACLSELEPRRDGLAAAQEAVDIYRMLADPDTGNPAAYLPALATSLNNLGAFLSRLEPRQDGLAAAQEAVDIRRVLADPDTGNPAVYLPDLAMSLASRAIVLQGQDAGAAVASMEEAVHVWSALADQIPDAFGPLLRRGLTSLVDLLEGAGRDEEAAKVRELLTHTG